MIKSIKVHTLKMELVTPFQTSFGTILERDLIITEITDENDVIGWGEGSAFSSPWYTEETTNTMLHVLDDFLIPLLLQHQISHPRELRQLFSTVRRNQMAKAALEGAVWDLYCKRKGVSLSNEIGGGREFVDSGVAVGIQPEEQLLKTIEQYVKKGYKRIKLKVKPGLEHEILKPVRKHFPNVGLMIDANSAYTLDDLHELKQLDQYELLMLEQPLGANDVIDHSILQKHITTPICLDESISSLEDAKTAIELGSCQIINVKIARVGGLQEALMIHDYCLKRAIPVWCGGMLETGIGRAHNLALASLQNFVFPHDISESKRYWKEDIIERELEVEKGRIQVPDGLGIGVKVNRRALESFTKETKFFHI